MTVIKLSRQPPRSRQVFLTTMGRRLIRHYAATAAEAAPKEFLDLLASADKTHLPLATSWDWRLSTNRLSWRSSLH